MCGFENMIVDIYCNTSNIDCKAASVVENSPRVEASISFLSAIYFGGERTCWTRYCSDKSNPHNPRREIDMKPTKSPPCSLVFIGRKMVTRTGERNIVCHDRNQIPDLTGPIDRMTGEERNVAAIPTMTAIARKPAIRGVEKLEYCDRNAIIEPEN